MTILDLPLIKTYLRIEQTFIEEDTLLTLMGENAETYIENACGVINLTNDKMLKQAKLLALVLVTDFYVNRELTGKPSDKVRLTVDSLIAQIRYAYDTVTVII